MAECCCRQADLLDQVFRPEAAIQLRAAAMSETNYVMNQTKCSLCAKVSKDTSKLDIAGSALAVLAEMCLAVIIRHDCVIGAQSDMQRHAMLYSLWARVH